MDAEKVQELLGVTAEDLDDQVEQERLYSQMMVEVGEADPQVLTHVARMCAKQAADLVVNGDVDLTAGQMLGMISRLSFFVTLMAKRVDHDNLTSLLVEAG